MIKILEKHVADKIAAGEVVERPLSVIKELMENSIDAGASSIIVEIKNGGKSYMRVTDDGCGINADEAVLAFMRHATSKITTDRDLEKIETLGFRGEALASISSVSRTELLTKEAETKLGKRVVIAGGIPVENVETGCPDGTTVIVKDLFFNTPARLKFMKSDSAESSLIIDFVSQIALAYPKIKIRLINNDSILFSTNGKGDIKNNILTIYSGKTANLLIPVALEREYASITGYVSPPDASGPTRKNQVFFVNGRVVSSKVIEKGITEAYSDRLFAGRHPSAFLFIKTAPDKLDVNIHPNKREVRFDDNGLISDLVRDGIKTALSTKEALPQIKSHVFKLQEESLNYKVREEKSGDNGSVIKSTEIKEGDLSKATPKEIKVKSEQVDIKNLLSTLRDDESKKYENEAEILENDLFTDEKSNVKPFDFRYLSIAGVVWGTYIMFTDEDCFYMLDQHAAHERIFFEKLLNQYKNSEKLQQPIMLPLILRLPYGVKEASRENMDILSSMGFDIEEFGPSSYAVKAIPMFMSLSEAEDFLNYYMENAFDGVISENKSKLEKIMINACKSAVKAGDLLKTEEINELVRELSLCDNPYSCPHGRPTFIKMTKYEIEKMFKR